MNSNFVKIVGVGGYLPEKVLTNFDLEKIVETTDEWITQRTGIKERHIAKETQTTSDLAVEASKKAILNAKLDINDVDLIIVATTTPDATFPSTACFLQKKLGIQKPIIAFDVQAVCSGFIYALSVANDMIQNRNIKNALVVGADKMTSLIDWNDRTTCVLFGDGAGAVVLQKTDKNDKSKIIDSQLFADGNYCDILTTNGGVSCKKNKLNISNYKKELVETTAGVVKMDGRCVFKHAVEKMTNSINDILNKNNFSLDDVKMIIPHQANFRILTLVAEKLGIDPTKFLITIGQHANTSSASIPLALDFALQNKMIKQGDLLIFEALGGGLTWGSVLLRF